MSGSFIIDGSTKLCALLGSPVAHSLSPAMHNTAFRLLGINCVYLCFDVTEADLEKAAEGLRKCNVLGFNVTMPDKKKMFSLSDDLSPAARLIGAVNTVVNKDGRLIGHNTDGAGFLHSAADAGWTAPGESVVILGAGGAASAIAAQAAIDGARSVTIAGRPRSRFRKSAGELLENIRTATGCHTSFVNMEDEAELKDAIESSSLLVNATPVGMEDSKDQSLIEDPSMFHRDLFVADLIYSPVRTRLLHLAEDAGCRVFNGMFMLLYQGSEAFRLWTGRDMPVEEIRKKYFSAE